VILFCPTKGRGKTFSSRQTSDAKLWDIKLTYDPRRNIGYLRFHEKTAEVETIQVSDSLNVDIAPDGTTYAIELLNANKQLRGDNGAHFVIVNQAVGETEDVALEI
jgi:uncharacterized protein YuzE